MIPKVTTIETPRPAAAKRRRGEDTTTLTIKYLEQSPDPKDLLRTQGSSSDGGGDDGGWVDTWDDDWGDEGGDDGEGSGDPSPQPTAPVEPIPPAFVLDASGLPPRGDLCR